MASYSADDYYKMATAVAEELPAKVKTRLERYLSEPAIARELTAIIKPWVETELSKSQYYDQKMSLTNILWYVNATQSASRNVSDSFKAAKNTRKWRKQYLSKVVHGEQKKGTGRIFSAAEEYLRTSSITGDCRFSSVEDYVSSVCADISVWKSSAETDLIDYPLFEYLKPKKRAELILIDVSYYLYDIVITKYHGNPVEGFRTSAPTVMINAAWFGANVRDVAENPEYNFSPTEITAVETNTVTQPDNSVLTTRLVTKTVEGAFGDTDKLSDRDKEQLITTLMDSGQFQLASTHLDAKDESMFVALYNSFNMDEIADQLKVISMEDLAKMLDIKPNNQNYVAIMRRLDKMMRYRLTYMRRSEDGTIKDAGTTILFSRIGFQHSSDEPDGGSMSFSMQDSTSTSSYIDELEKQGDLKELLIAIEPSPFLKSVMQRNITFSILTRMYLAINPPNGDSDKVKSLALVLQEDRTRLYPEHSVTHDYRFFIERLGYKTYKPARVKKQLEDAFRYLRDSEILIKDYVLSPYSITIDYIPFTDAERNLCVVEAISGAV